MAQLDLESFQRVDKERCSVQEKIPATYTSYVIDGVKYVQIDTYGRKNRKYPDKPSQVLQFDRKAAEFLIELFKKELDI